MYGPLKAGVSFLPLALTIGASAGLASQLSTKLGPKPVLIVQAVGLYWFSHVSARGIAALSGVQESESGLASGLMATAQQIGQAVGLAVLTGVATTTRTTAEALTAGFQDAFLVAGACALIAALAAALIIRQTSAIGRTGDPVPPRSFKGRQTNPNSLTPSAASSSR
jgi:hypothetical protein